MWWFHSTIILELFYAPLPATALGLYESFQNFVAVWLWTYVRSHIYFHCKNLPQHFVCVFFLQLFSFHVFLPIKIMPLKITISLQSWNSVFQFRVFKLVVFQHIFFYAYKYYPVLNISCISQWVPFSWEKKKKKRQYSRRGIMRTEEMGKINSLYLLATQPRIWLAFLAASIYWWLLFSFFFVHQYPPNLSLQSCCLSTHCPASICA